MVAGLLVVDSEPRHNGVVDGRRYGVTWCSLLAVSLSPSCHFFFYHGFEVGPSVGSKMPVWRTRAHPRPGPSMSAVITISNLSGPSGRWSPCCRLGVGPSVWWAPPWVQTKTGAHLRCRYRECLEQAKWPLVSLDTPVWWTDSVMVLTRCLFLVVS